MTRIKGVDVQRGDELEIILKDGYVFERGSNGVGNVLKYLPGEKMGDGREKITGYFMETADSVVLLSPGWDTKRNTPDIRAFYHQAHRKAIANLKVKK